MALDVPESHADLLEAANVATLTTVGKDGLPQSTAVWFIVDDDGELKSSITDVRQKYKNLVAHPKATLLIIDPSNPYRTLEIRAEVRLTPDPEKALIRKLAARYGMDDPQPLLDLPGERYVVTFDPVRIVTNG